MANADYSIKTCSKCGETKPLCEFTKNKSSSGGHRPDCKTCRLVINRLWREKNRERLNRKAVERRNLDPAAKERYRIHARERYRANPEEMNKRAREAKLKRGEDYLRWYKDYTERNREKTRERNRQWYQENKDRKQAKAKEWLKNNKDRRDSYLRDYAQKNKDRIRAYQEQWKKENPEKVSAVKRRRRGKEANVEGSHTAQDIFDLSALQKNRCACCKKSLKDGFHIDHIIPISKGGPNDRYNLQLLCPTCNFRILAKDPIKFMQENGFLL